MSVPSGTTVNQVLRVEGLSISYDGREVVSGVSLNLAPGETVAIVGESGSGKTTVINAILGLLPATATATGAIFVEGAPVLGAAERDLRSLRGTTMAYVPQDPMSNLNPVVRVGRQVAEAALVAGGGRVSDHNEAAVAALERAGLEDAQARFRLYPHQFSGGMRQRALIAMGLVNAPRLLIADEPTSALDVTVQRTILDNLAQLVAESGTSVLLITHDLGLAAERADRVIVMRHGRVVEEGPSREVLFAPREEYTRALVAAAPFATARRLEVETEEASAAPAAPLEEDEPPIALEVSGLCKTYPARGFGKHRLPEFVAVSDMNFSIRAGRTLAIAGESGSGKSTTAQMVLQLLKPTGGSIRYRGAEVSAMPRGEREEFRRNVQSVFQDPYASLDPLFTVERSLREPLDAFALGSARERQQRIAELLNMVRLPRSVLQRTASELSGGQRQRVAIARALAPAPQLIVCDEPVSALDVLVQAQVLEVLTEIQRELGVSYLFISHDLSVIEEVAHEVLIMRRGQVVERGATGAVLASPAHPYTRDLLDSIPGAALFREAAAGQPLHDL